jgi:hypothetical protein
MKTIRNNVFETNSSSSHSLCIGASSELSPSYLTIDHADNCVHVEFGEFGWGYDKINDQYDKLAYLITMLVETEGNKCKSMLDLRNTKGFNLINETIKGHCNCDGIIIDSSISPSTWNTNYVAHDGYIDHQSYEDYHTLQDFLNDWEVTIEQFIFNYDLSLIIDNDNG